MVTTRAKRTVNAASIGKCEHCGDVFTIEDFPVDALDAEWECGKCGGTLTEKSFGMELVEDKWKKTRWVNGNREWTKEEPTDNFNLGSWLVILSPLTP